VHPKQNSISYPQYASNLLHWRTSHHPTTQIYSNHHIFLYLALQPHPLSSSATAPLPTLHELWNGLPKDLCQFAHPPNPPLNFAYPPLALYSATFHSRLNSLSYPIPVPLLHHHTSTIITDCNRSPMLSPRLNLSGF